MKPRCEGMQGFLSNLLRHTLVFLDVGPDSLYGSSHSPGCSVQTAFMNHNRYGLQCCNEHSVSKYATFTPGETQG